MFDIALRRWKDSLIDPLTPLIPSSITPLHITLAAFICGLLSCLIAATPSSTNHPLSLALTLWLLNRFLDCLDGAVARHRATTSPLGGFLDLLSDFIIYSLLPIAVALGRSSSSFYSSAVVVDVNWLALALLEASFHINNFVLFYSAAVAAGHADADELTSVTMRPALVEGFESGVLFTAMLVWPRHINFWMWAMGGGVVVGTAQRVVAVVAALRVLDVNGMDADADDGEGKRKGEKLQ